MPLTDFHLVLDLDATLVCSDASSSYKRFCNINLYQNPNTLDIRKRFYHMYIAGLEMGTPPGHGDINFIWGTYRPYTLEFIKFAVLYFKKIHIYSAGQYKYVENIADFLLGNYPDAMGQILCWDDCHQKQNKHITKPLSKIYELEPSANDMNTLLLDDLVDNFEFNPNNGIVIPAYTIDYGLSSETLIEEIAKNDDSLLRLMMWLCTRHVISCQNLSDIKKEHIFDFTPQQYIDHVDATAWNHILHHVNHLQPTMV